MVGEAAATLRAHALRRPSRMISGWAVVLSCALHGAVGVLWWSDRIAPTSAREAEPALIVVVVPVKDPAPAFPSVQAPAPTLAPVSGAAPTQASESASVPLSQSVPRAARAGLPSASQPSARPSAARKGAQPPSAVAAQPDFRWREADAEVVGLPRARGEPVYRLAPKAREEPSALAQGMAKAARPSCKDAHAGGGLLALPMLLADTLSDRGCKW
ncbi:MAG: hypothetical protein ACN6PR_07150 [Achromobacter sp.]